MNRTDDPLKLVADLRPAMLDQLADDAYIRNRGRDLARAAGEDPGRSRLARGPRRPTSGRRWQRGSLAAGAVAVTAAAAIAVVAALAGAPAVRRQQAPGRGTEPGTASSARSFLLASAVRAASAPALTGTYWYTKERDIEPTMPLARAGKRAPEKIPHALLPGITYAATQESWYGQDTGRTIVDEDVTFGFASAAVKARWRAMGEPPLATADGTRTRPSTSNYAMTFRYGPGAGLTMAGIERLPATRAGLGATLRRMWDSIPDRAAVVGLPRPTFADYVFAWASSLLTGPASPGTRAAAYRLLAQQPGITIIASVTDPLGRRGVAIADGQGYGGRDYMIIDPRTAQELAYTTQPVRANSALSTAQGGVETYEAMGWTNKLGARPTP
jgi:hypothetical protein